MSQMRYSEKLKDALDELRPAFRDMGEGLAKLTKRREDLAPAFHKAWLLWRRETHRPRIAFLQALDPSIPANRNAYRKHPSYRAAEYLSGLVTNPEGKKRKGLTPLSLLAVAIKSFLPLCGSQKEQKEALALIMAASKWRESDQARLLTAIRRASAVGLPNAPRLVAMKTARAVVAAFERDRAVA